MVSRKPPAPKPPAMVVRAAGARCARTASRRNRARQWNARGRGAGQRQLDLRQRRKGAKPRSRVANPLPFSRTPSPPRQAPSGRRRPVGPALPEAPRVEGGSRSKRPAQIKHLWTLAPRRVRHRSGGERLPWRRQTSRRLPPDAHRSWHRGRAANRFPNRCRRWPEHWRCAPSADQDFAGAGTWFGAGTQRRACGPVAAAARVHRLQRAAVGVRPQRSRARRDPGTPDEGALRGMARAHLPDKRDLSRGGRTWSAKLARLPCRSASARGLSALLASSSSRFSVVNGIHGGILLALAGTPVLFRRAAA